jgi:hypothetical protein
MEPAKGLETIAHANAQKDSPKMQETSALTSTNAPNILATVEANPNASTLMAASAVRRYPEPALAEDTFHPPVLEAPQFPEVPALGRLLIAARN